jgi:hypothetical protein
MIMAFKTKIVSSATINVKVVWIANIARFVKGWREIFFPKVSVIATMVILMMDLWIKIV